jgi:hypothetical protein
MRAKRKRARGRLARLRNIWAVYVLPYISFSSPWPLCASFFFDAVTMQLRYQHTSIAGSKTNAREKKCDVRSFGGLEGWAVLV